MDNRCFHNVEGGSGGGCADCIANRAAWDPSWASAEWEERALAAEAKLARAREETIRECAAAMGNSGDYDTEKGEAWLLNFFSAELSAKAPGR